MPPGTVSTHSRRLCRLLQNPFGSFLYCPYRMIWRLGPTFAGCAPRLSKNRGASTLVSATAVNATKSIPTKNRDLHQALIELGKKASGQVNISRLQLAIQGLEREHPTTRIALLGLNVPATARRLARLLLAESSKPPQEWETQLLEETSDQQRDVVVRFGIPHNAALQVGRTSLPILLVSAPILQQQGTEILISSVNDQHSKETLSRNIPSDVWLSPAVRTQLSADGRQSLISQPVHRTIVLADGIDELLSVAKLLARTKFESRLERDLVDVVVNLDGITRSADSQNMRVDLLKAEEGLQAVREALDKALDFEIAWSVSGLSALSKWLASSSAKSTSGLSPLLRDLVATVVEATAGSIVSQAKQADTIAHSKMMTNEARISLQNAISIFSQEGHAELQSGLAAAWSSRNWRKLAFWKLFWRVDDVALIVTDLITTTWLPRTERAIYELSGRMKQAGISLPSYSTSVVSESRTATVSTKASERETATEMSGQPLILASSASIESVSTTLLPPARTVATTSPIPFRTPFIASKISMSRQAFISATITTLTSSAQQIVLRSLTLTGVSAALSALSFLSITTGNIYESATVFALGTAFALRRMQKEWEAQCKNLEHGLMQEGRSVLKQTEETLRRLVDEASHFVEDEVEVRSRREALDAVEKARTALKEHQ